MERAVTLIQNRCIHLVKKKQENKKKQDSPQSVKEQRGQEEEVRLRQLRSPLSPRLGLEGEPLHA